MSLFSLFKKKQSSGVFVPAGGSYKEFKGDVKNGSYVNIMEAVGYHPDKVYMYYAATEQGGDIQAVGVEIFTDNIVFVETAKSVTALNKKGVARFLRDFDLKETFDSVKANEILQEGIENRSLDIAFLARVLNIKDPKPGGIHFAEALDLNLYFTNGYLVEFQSSNGLNEWANLFNKPGYSFVQRYREVAKLYWGDNNREINDEVNLQATAAANVPNVMQNKFIELHRDEDGLINFYMLLVCHYNQEISLQQFLKLNHGRYTEMPVDEESYANETRKYRLGMFIYEFNDNGTLRGTILS